MSFLSKKKWKSRIRNNTFRKSKSEQKLKIIHSEKVNLKKIIMSQKWKSENKTQNLIKNKKITKQKSNSYSK